jgi:hypothetical protein
MGIDRWLVTASRLNDNEREVFAVRSVMGVRWESVVNLFGVCSVAAFGEPTISRRFVQWAKVDAVPFILSPRSAALVQRQSQDDLYSTTEIAEALDIHPIMLGKLTKHLKVKMYGERHPAPALYNDAVIEQWFWNEAGRAAVLREFGRSSRPTVCID